MSDSTAPPVRSRWNCCSSRASRYAIFGTLAITGCLLDLITKSWAFSWLGSPQPGRLNIYWIVEGYVGLETTKNYGALFGMGQGKVWFFALMSFVALVGIAYWLVRKRAVDDWYLAMTLGIVTGGILGNLYDRLGFWSRFEEHAVRDWIRLSYNGYVWPNFNVADSLLVCGAALLVWHSLAYPPPGQESGE